MVQIGMMSSMNTLFSLVFCSLHKKELSFFLWVWYFDCGLDCFGTCFILAMAPTKKQVDLRKGRWQRIGWLWSADFVVGVEHVDVLNYFCLLIRWCFRFVVLKISTWCRLCFILILFWLFVDFDKILNKFIYLFDNFLGNYFMPTLPSKFGMLVCDNAL